MTTIDLNADVGEGIGMDAQLMPFLTSCNIACGVHAGDTSTMQETIRLAIQHHVKIGAHPSFPDRENFGREEMELPHEELRTTITDQVNFLKGIAEDQGAQLHHVKPHGALYNMAMLREDIAMTVVSAMLQFNTVRLYAPYGSVISTLAKKAGVKIYYEVFADRNYNDDLALVSRKHKNAMLHDPTEIAMHVIRMIRDHQVKTINGNFVHIEANTVCVHGDNPQAIEIVKKLQIKLRETGINIV